MPHRFIQARPGFEANGVEAQLHVDVRMRQKAETQTTKINSAKVLCRGPSAKIYTLEIYLLYSNKISTDNYQVMTQEQEIAVTSSSTCTLTLIYSCM